MVNVYLGIRVRGMCFMHHISNKKSKDWTNSNNFIAGSVIRKCNYMYDNTLEPTSSKSGFTRRMVLGSVFIYTETGSHPSKISKGLLVDCSPLCTNSSQNTVPLNMSWLSCLKRSSLLLYHFCNFQNAPHTPDTASHLSRPLKLATSHHPSNFYW